MSKKLFFSTCIMFLLCGFIYAQKTITGKVVDVNNIPLIGVNVIVKNANTGTTTDFDGNYSLSIKNNSAIIEVSYMGYKTIEVPVGSQTVINIILKEDAETLDEVIITAQGIKKSKKALGYAITTLESKDIEQRPEADLARSLQGKVAGLKISAVSGQTGTSSPITIRGSNSLTQTNTPLIIVNDVPFYGLLRDLDPNNIVSMSVLKGLNASVLYGSQGRNGVILIQTKSGDSDLGETKIKASYSTTSYLNTVSQLPEYQNLYGNGQANVYIPSFLSVWGAPFSSMEEVEHPYSTAGLGDVFPELDGLMIPYEAQENHVKNLFNQGIGTIHSFNVSTSNNKSAFNLSTGYTDEKGILEHNDLKRFNIGLGGKIQVNDKLNLSATLNYSTRKVNTVQGAAIFNVVFYLPPNIDLTELPYQNPLTGESVYYRGDVNPLWLLHNAGNNTDVVRTYGTFSADYKFNDNLNLTYRIGYDSDQRDTNSYSNKGGYDGSYQFGYLDLGYAKDVNVDQAAILNYNNDFTSDLNFDAQVGLTSKIKKYKSFSSESLGQIVYGFVRPSNYSTTSPTVYSSNTTNFAGLFGQFQFSYKNYLYATLSGRNDWGSTVEKENQALLYPGASLSFIPTSAFNFGGNAVNYLKLRGAYASSSGYPDPYGTRNKMILDAQRFAAYDGSFPITNRFSAFYANPDLKPELHKEIEIGLEAKFLNNRISLEASMYKRVSEDQVVQSLLPLTTGYDYKYINLGRIDNEGIEVDLGIDVVKTNNFSWKLRNIFTAQESLVVKTTDADSDINLSHDRYAVVGQPLGVIKGDYAMRDDEGNLLVSGNGSSTRVGEVIVSSDIGLSSKVIGDPNPDWQLTTISDFSYKNFSFSAQIEYSHGGEIHSSAVEDMLERGVTKDSENRNGSFIIPGYLADDATGELLLDPQGNKIENNIQMAGIWASYSNYYNANDLSMWDTSVFRLREIAVSYTLDSKQMRKLPFERVDFTLSGRNLWYVAPNFPKYINYDPETDEGMGVSQVPSSKRFSLGLAITF
ncbi:SusC/RagA family TonB-linked outer membrane protein [Pseudalgibacter alginicilyticus]|nr:SusC/RagA family TonB-linked outer membrane protein [Pseudalgibacter alginicilyticus]